MTKTAAKVEDLSGNKLYQQRAKLALPILVRQAECREPIYYEDLAEELGMTNPRNLNYVLGSVGVSLEKLTRLHDWGDVPHIQSLAISKARKLPGSGFEDFLESKISKYRSLSLAEKREYFDAYWGEIYAYPYWREILNFYDLRLNTTIASEILTRSSAANTLGGGEGEEHRQLKEHLLKNPQILGLGQNSSGSLEYPLPSGDKIDVVFTTENEVLAVEVKSRISKDNDIIRGLFQCVKYQAVLEAARGFSGKKYSIETVLLVGRGFPQELRPLRNSLGIRVIEVLNYRS